MTITPILVCILVGYFFGSIPFGLILTHLKGLGDIRSIGSGNIGATNVLRTGHKGLALLTVLLDASKAGFIAFICMVIYKSMFLGLCAGTAGVIGHIFPIWLHFKGGKGVASCFGVFCFLTPIIGIMSILTWLSTALITKYSSLSAIVMFLLTPIYAYLITKNITIVCFYSVLSLIGLYRHKANINRLIKGQESKISLRKNS